MRRRSGLLAERLRASPSAYLRDDEGHRFVCLSDSHGCREEARADPSSTSHHIALARWVGANHARGCERSAACVSGAAPSKQASDVSLVRGPLRRSLRPCPLPSGAEQGPGRGRNARRCRFESDPLHTFPNHDAFLRSVARGIQLPLRYCPNSFFSRARSASTRARSRSAPVS
jgi:hypothetical protein